MGFLHLKRSLVAAIFFTLTASGCGGGGGSSGDADAPSETESMGRIVLRSAQIGGSGAVSLSSTATNPRIGGGSASVGQVSAIGVAGGGSAPTLLAGFWPVAERASAEEGPPVEALLLAAVQNSPSNEPEALAIAGAGGDRAILDRSASDPGLSQTRSSEGIDRSRSSRNPAAVPALSAIGQLLLVLLATLGGAMSAARLR